MKIQLVMIIKNGAETIIQCLESYIGHIDRFFIVDTGSTDQTLELLKKFSNDHSVDVVLKQEIFKGFSNTRNKALDLSHDLEYDFTIMPDDSYNLVGNFEELERIKKNYNLNCFTCNIMRNSITYKSKRIFRTSSKLRFHGTIHEVLGGSEDYHLQNCLLNDVECETQKERSVERCHYDLKCLGELNDPRSLYYRACVYIQLYKKGLKTLEECIEMYKLRTSCHSSDHEETFMSFFHIGNIYCMLNDNKEAIKNYLSAAIIFPSRQGECYLFIYLLTGSKFYINKAFKNRFVGKFRLAIDIDIYSNNGNYGLIEKNYYLSFKNDMHRELLNYELILNRTQ